MLTLAQDRGKWTASCPWGNPPPPSAHLVGGWEGLRANVDVVEEVRNLADGMTPNTPSSLPTAIIWPTYYINRVAVA
jgi:hypothetical protein